MADTKVGNTAVAVAMSFVIAVLVAFVAVVAVVAVTAAQVGAPAPLDVNT